MANSRQDAEIISQILKEETLDGKQQENEYRLRIYDELRKGDDMDTDLIDEYIRLSLLIEGKEYDEDIDVKEEIKKAKKRAAASRPMFRKILDFRLSKLVLALCCVVALIAAANFFIVQATGSGINDYVVDFGKNYIGINFLNYPDKAAQKQGTVSDNELYKTMQSECEQYGLTPLLTTQMPSGYKQQDFTKQETSVSKDADFLLADPDNTIVLNIEYYPNTDYLLHLKLPGATDLTRFNDDGMDIYLAKESSKYVSTFYNDHYVYTISSPLGHDETVAIIKSFK
jgi:hypothetical protein